MLIPAIHFPGTCTEAMALYQKALGAEVISVVRYGDAPTANEMPEAHRALVMHAEMTIHGTQLNVCDALEEKDAGNRHLFNLFFETEEAVHAAYHALSEGGEVITALGPQFWSANYADLRDRFGVRWQLMG